MGQKTEKPYNEKGHFVQIPTVLFVLLTPIELMVLCVIIDKTNRVKKPVSQSLFMALTGRDKKSIRQALDSLIRLKIIKKGRVYQDGTLYTVDEQLLKNMVERINNYHNPVTRLKYSDAIRGSVSTNTIHDFVIKALSNTSIDRDSEHYE